MVPSFATSCQPPRSKPLQVRWIPGRLGKSAQTCSDAALVLAIDCLRIVRLEGRRFGTSSRRPHAIVVMVAKVTRMPVPLPISRHRPHAEDYRDPRHPREAPSGTRRARQPSWWTARQRHPP